MLQAGDRVRLVAFNGKQAAPSDVRADEDYWRLIGWRATVVQSPSEAGLVASFSAEPRLLVQFDHSVSALNLHCHNDVPNSLWILESDLVADTAPEGVIRADAVADDQCDALVRRCDKRLRQLEAGMITSEEFLNSLYDHFVHSGIHDLSPCWEPCFQALPESALASLLAHSKTHQHLPMTFAQSYVSDAIREAAQRAALDIQAKLVRRLEAYLSKPR